VLAWQESWVLELVQTNCAGEHLLKLAPSRGHSLGQTSLRSSARFQSLPLNLVRSEHCFLFHLSVSVSFLLLLVLVLLPLLRLLLVLVPALMLVDQAHTRARARKLSIYRQPVVLHGSRPRWPPIALTRLNSKAPTSENWIGALLWTSEMRPLIPMKPLHFLRERESGSELKQRGTASGVSPLEVRGSRRVWRVIDYTPASGGSNNNWQPESESAAKESRPSRLRPQAVGPTCSGALFETESQPRQA